MPIPELMRWYAILHKAGGLRGEGAAIRYNRSITPEDWAWFTDNATRAGKVAWHLNP
jgi:hypothetical protein